MSYVVLHIHNCEQKAPVHLRFSDVKVKLTLKKRHQKSKCKDIILLTVQHDTLYSLVYGVMLLFIDLFIYSFI